MNSGIIPGLMAQLAGQSPVLIVYVLGIVLAVIFWRRCPTPCLFTLIAMVVLLVTAIAQSFITIYVVQRWTPSQAGTYFMIIGIVGGVLRAGAMGLVLAAVFVGRRSNVAQGFPVLPVR